MAMMTMTTRMMTKMMTRRTMTRMMAMMGEKKVEGLVRSLLRLLLLVLEVFSNPHILSERSCHQEAHVRLPSTHQGLAKAEEKRREGKGGYGY